MIVGLVALGRLGLRPLFRGVARTHSPELFMAACLLVVLVTGLAAAAAGLSMELGALIAGLLLAETEYRRQIEVTVEPFKGLLLGRVPDLDRDEPRSRRGWPRSRFSCWARRSAWSRSRPR